MKEQLSVQKVVGEFSLTGDSMMVTHQIQYVYVLIGQYPHNLFLTHFYSRQGWAELRAGQRSGLQYVWAGLEYGTAYLAHAMLTIRSIFLRFNSLRLTPVKYLRYCGILKNLCAIFTTHLLI